MDDLLVGGWRMVFLVKTSIHCNCMRDHFVPHLLTIYFMKLLFAIQIIGVAARVGK